MSVDCRSNEVPFLRQDFKSYYTRTHAEIEIPIAKLLFFERIYLVVSGDMDYNSLAKHGDIESLITGIGIIGCDGSFRDHWNWIGVSHHACGIRTLRLFETFPTFHRILKTFFALEINLALRG